MNLGGPDRWRRCGRFSSICSAIRRSFGCRRRCGCRWRALIAWRRAPVAQRDLSPARRRVAAARQHRGAGARAGSSAWDRTIAASSRCAIGIRERCRRRARSTNGRRTRSSACRSIRNSRRRRRLRRSPLGATRHDASGLDVPDQRRVLLSLRSGVYRSAGRADPPALDAGCRMRQAAATVAHRARPAEKDRARLAIPTRTGRERPLPRWSPRLNRPGLDWRGLLSEPRRAARMDRPGDRRGDSPRRRRRGRRSSWRRSRSSRSIPKLWSSSTSITAIWRERRRAGLSPGADGRDRAAVHRGRLPSGAAALASGSGRRLRSGRSCACPDAPLERLACGSLSLDEGAAHRQHGRLDGRACSICRGSTSTTPRCRPDRPRRRPSRSWSAGCCAASCAGDAR